MKQKKNLNTLVSFGGLLTIIGLTLSNDHKPLQLFILLAGVIVSAIGVIRIEKSRKKNSKI